MDYSGWVLVSALVEVINRDTNEIMIPAHEFKQYLKRDDGTRDPETMSMLTLMYQTRAHFHDQFVKKLRFTPTLGKQFLGVNWKFDCVIMETKFETWNETRTRLGIRNNSF